MNDLSPSDQRDLAELPPEATRADLLAGIAEQIAADVSPTDLVKLAIACRDRGHADVAAELLTDLIERTPNVSAAYYELAFLHRLRGEHLPAAMLLEKSLRRAGDDGRTRRFLAHMLYALGAFAEGDRTLDAMPAGSDVNEHDLAAMFEFGAFLRAYPLGRTLFLLSQIKARARYLTPQETGDAIDAALREHSPFALVRLGDGEGAWLTLGAADEAAHRQLYQNNRAEFCKIWFGAEGVDEESKFAAIAKSLMARIAECDVIGIPYQSWIEHEYRISSTRGIPSLVNIVRAFAGRDITQHNMLCPQDVHVELHTQGVLERILRRARGVTVITCLEEVAALLEQRFGLDEVTLHRIPGEHARADLLGPDALTGLHFPTVFEQLQAELSRPHEGRLFLVAGGLLGKLYTATIRRHGGIALDIGSLIDAWTGRYTRPGYDSRLAI